MSRYIVDIHGEIEGDFDIIGKYVEPTADVVEVVRCKDCKHFDNYTCTNDYVSRNINDCGCYPSLSVYGDDYCSYGERRKDEQVH